MKVGTASTVRRGPVDLSVIIPCRNPGPHFAGLLASLARQQLSRSWEVIVVDNGLTEEHRAIAARASQYLTLTIVEATEKVNASYARNVGVLAAAGDLICFVDADDELAPGYLAAMASALESHDFVASRVDSVTLNLPWVLQAHGPPWQQTEVEVFFDFLPSAGINVGLRRSMFQAVGGFREEFSGSQDIEFSWRVQMVMGASIQFVPEAVYRYRYRCTLRGLYRQASNWGLSNVLLYSRFRQHGMPSRSLRVAVREWFSVAVRLLGARTKSDLAPVVVRLGYCIGRVRGSICYRTVYL